MNERDILNQYIRIRFHFLNKQPYNKYSHYNSKVLESFRKYIDVSFLQHRTFDVISMFFVWLFHGVTTTHTYSNTSSLFNSQEFKKFINDMRNYKKIMQDDFEKVYNTKNFNDFKKLMYKNDIGATTSYVVMRTIYRDMIKELESSNIYGSIWNDIKLLNTFINFDRDFVTFYVERLKERQ